MGLKLVPLGEQTPKEQEYAVLLAQHTGLRKHITLLLNEYRSSLVSALNAMAAGERDTADLSWAMLKRDVRVKKLGIPLFDTQEDWHQAFQEEEK